MQGRRFATLLLTAGLCAGSCAVSLCQGPDNPASQPNSASARSQPAPAVRRAHRHRTRRHVAAKSAITTIPLETAPPTPVTAASLEQKARQKAADDRLLAQQQAQSQKAAQITNATVKKAVQQQQSVQNEKRIQDAPGPVQTGLVPTSGPPVQPNQDDVRIQDAPGPTQTAPVQPSPAPASTPPATTPPPALKLLP